MNFDEFNSLSNDKQLATVWMDGKFVFDLITGNEKKVYYSLDGFYVELCYHSEDNKIVSVRPIAHASSILYQ